MKTRIKIIKDYKGNKKYYPQWYKETKKFLIFKIGGGWKDFEYYEPDWWRWVQISFKELSEAQKYIDEIFKEPDPEPRTEYVDYP